MFKNKIYKFLSKENLDEISLKIKNIEKNNSTEIVVSIKYSIPFIFNNNIEKFSHTLFKNYKVFNTKSRTGILILFVLKTKQFFILGDIGIYEKVNKNEWNLLSKNITEKIHNKNLLNGILFSIDSLSNLIKNNFSSDDLNGNELHNNVRT